MGDYTKLVTTTVMYGCYTKKELINFKDNISDVPSDVKGFLVGVGLGIVGLISGTPAAIAYLAFAGGTAWGGVTLSLSHSNASRIADELEDFINDMDRDEYAFVGIECIVTYTPRDLRDGTCSSVEPLRIKKLKNLGQDPMSTREIKEYIAIRMA